MTIAEQIEKSIQEKKEKLSKDADFKALQEFYEEMKKLGIAKKQEYELTPIDTIGFRYYQEQQTSL